jgi:hypothetical protein
MSKGKLIKVCGECANYDWEKHRCKIGCNEGEPQEPFFADCPLPTVDTKPTEWISVDERLPEPHKLVLCIWERVDDGWNYGFARYQREDVWYVSNEGMPRVTHWMPLPEPPMMKGGE